MKKYLLILCMLVTGLSACKKADDFDATAQAAIDDAAIQTWMKNNNVTAIHDPSGLYYQILTPGTGAYPNTNSTVTVNYTGNLLDGTAFDSSNGFVGSLKAGASNGVISGWQIGLQHINAGGRIRLIVPSALGYANNDYGSIPANSVLVFTIDLLSIQ